MQPGAARLSCLALALLLAVSLVACGKKEKASSGQALASVDGEEITMLQLNDELQRSGVPASRQVEGSKQLLESLIDRQLLLAAASKEKVDRDPKVVQAIERARALIVAQAYMQKQVGAPVKPTRDEVRDYFDKHPEFFAHRKQFDMRQLVLAGKDADADFNKVTDGAKSLEEVASWMDAHRVKFSRNQISRTSADLPPEMSKRLLELPKGQLFIVREGDRVVLSQIVEVKDVPAELEASTPQIEQYLATAHAKQAAANEVARLRGGAKIEYLNKAMAPSAAPAAAGKPAGDGAAAVKPVGDDAAAVRGVSGLK